MLVYLELLFFKGGGGGVILSVVYEGPKGSFFNDLRSSAKFDYSKLSGLLLFVPQF